MTEIALIGRGGQGIVTAASILADAALEEGRYPQKMATYGSARRGDLVRASVRIDEVPVRPRTTVVTADILIVADSTIPCARFRINLRPGGTLIIDGMGVDVPFAGTVYVVDARAVSRDVFGRLSIPLAGIVMLGAFLKATSILDIATVDRVLASHVALPLVEKNRIALRQGYERTFPGNPTPGTATAFKAAAPGRDLDGLQPYTLLPPGPVFRPGDLPDIRTGAWRSHRPVIDAGLCHVCRRCLHACPEGVLREGAGSMTIDYDHCKGCGICADRCLWRAVTLIEEHA